VAGKGVVFIVFPPCESEGFSDYIDFDALEAASAGGEREIVEDGESVESAAKE